MAPHSISPAPLPACARAFAEEIHAIEAELDTLWPDYERLPFVVPVPGGGNVMLEGYRLRGRPFTAQGMAAPPYRPEHVRRLKWLLKRHMLLMQGLDYGVFIAEGAGRQRGRCFAHPTNETRPHPEPPPAVPPPSFTSPAPPPTRAATPAADAIAAMRPYLPPTARPWRP